MSGRPPRYVPAPDGLHAEFYAECAKGRLAFQRCIDCGTWRHPPRVLCARCASWNWQWTPSSGRGRIYTWTVTHQAMHPSFAEDVPYAAIVVELAEGVRLVSSLRAVPLPPLALGLPVEVEIEPVSATMAIPFFRVVAGATV